MKKLVSVFVSFTVAALMSANSMAARITTNYDYEEDNGKVQLTGVNKTGQSQTMLVLSSDAETVDFDDVEWLYQKDDGTAFDAFYLKKGVYSELIEGESKTYYFRIGGGDGTLQRGTFTLEKAEPTYEPTQAPTQAPTEEPTQEPIEEATETPTAVPTAEPTTVPTTAPTEEPTTEPTTAPTGEPTAAPEQQLACSISVDKDNAKVSAQIVNTYSDERSVVIVLAQYNEQGDLVGLNSQQVTVPAGTSEYTVQADPVKEDMSYIRGFVWDGWKDMKPIQEIKTE